MSYAAIVHLVKLLWPLLKEGLFGNASVLETMKENKVATAWIIVCAICLLAVIALVAETRRLTLLYQEESIRRAGLEEKLVQIYEITSLPFLTDDLPDALIDKSVYDEVVAELLDAKELIAELEDTSSCPPVRRPSPGPRYEPIPESDPPPSDAKKNRKLLNGLRGLWK